MNPALEAMLARHAPRSSDEHLRALREIVQQIALLGFWRSRLFEHAAFYGGSALRILHGLDRFSEDLDLSLLAREAGFPLKTHLEAARLELEAFGLRAEAVERPRPGAIQAGDLLGEARDLLVALEAPGGIVSRLHREQRLRIKIELDTAPPPGFETEVRTLLLPVPHSVRTYSLPDMLAGKLHAALARRWKERVKGRDWYDLVWFLGRGVPVRLLHLQRRLERSGDWPADRPLDLPALLELLDTRLEALDVAAARADVEPFVTDADSLRLWSREFFSGLLRAHLQAV